MKKKILACCLLIAILLSSCLGASWEDYNESSFSINESTVSTESQDIELNGVVHETDTDYIIVTTENTTKRTLRKVTVRATYYKDGEMLKVEEDFAFHIPNGRKLAFALEKPINEEHQIVDYDEVDISVYDNSEYAGVGTNASDNIKTKYRKGVNGTVIKCSNTGTEIVSYLQFQVLYYQGDKIVGCEMAGYSHLIHGKPATLSVAFPRNLDNRVIKFDRYEVLLIEAYFTNMYG